MKKKPKRSGANWTQEDRDAHGDMFVQTRLNPDDAAMMRLVKLPHETPQAVFRRLLRTEAAKLAKQPGNSKST